MQVACSNRGPHPSPAECHHLYLLLLVGAACVQAVINIVTLGVSLLVALFTPGGAEKVYAIVGATGEDLLGPLGCG
jgi:hypothetical protein